MALLGIEGFSVCPTPLKPGCSFSGISPGAAQVNGLYTNNKLMQMDPTTSTSSEYRMPITGGGSGVSLVVGFSGKHQNVTNICTFLGDALATAHLTLQWNALKQVVLRRGTDTGAILATSSPFSVVDINTRHYFEVKISAIADAGANVIVKVNEVEVINFTGDTKNGGTNAWIDSFKFLSDGGNVVNYGDMYWLSTTGAAPYNDFMGDQIILTLDPNGNGASSQFVGSDGNSVDNYLLVDENPFNTTDYVGSPTAGDRDFYTMSDCGIAGTVHCVQAHVYAQKTDSGARSIKLTEREPVGPTVQLSTTQPLSTSYTVLSGPVWLTDADGTAWTVAKVNAMQIGVENV